MQRMVQINPVEDAVARAAKQTFQDVAAHLPALGQTSPALSDRFVDVRQNEDGQRTVLGLATHSAPDASGRRVNVVNYAFHEINTLGQRYGRGIAVLALDGKDREIVEVPATPQEVADFAMGLVRTSPSNFSAIVQRTPADSAIDLVERLLCDDARL